jgi:hypothetical protein
VTSTVARRCYQIVTVAMIAILNYSNWARATCTCEILKLENKDEDHVMCSYPSM